MTVKRITREEAEAAIVAAAKDDHIAFITALPGGAVRRDGFDVATARLILAHSELFAYQEGPFGFNLAVLSGATVYHFDVPMPEDQMPVEADDILERHGGTILVALSRMVGQDDITRDREMAALRVIRNYLGRDW